VQLSCNVVQILSLVIDLVVLIYQAKATESA